MTGKQVPVLDLPGGCEVHLEPHAVHGVLITPKASGVDVEVEHVEFAGEDHLDVLVYWHSCPRYLGAEPDYCGCTLYDRTQCVLVIGHLGAAA